MPRRELHALFVAAFDRPELTVDNIKSLCTRRGWKTGRTGCFAKGSVPANKGKKMPFNPASARTQFKKGQVPRNAKPVGHERIDNKQGYVWILVAERNPHTGYDRRFVFKHRHLWEQVNGPLPDDHVLKCLDGNKLNCDPSNWEAVPRAILPRLAGKWSVPYDSAPDELKPAIMAVAKLQHAVREKAAK